MKLPNLVEQALTDPEVKRLFNLEMLTHEHELLRFLEIVSAGANDDELRPYIDNFLDIPFFTDDIPGTYSRLRAVLLATLNQLDRRRCKHIIDMYDVLFSEYRNHYQAGMEEARSKAANLTELIATELFEATTSIDHVLEDTYQQICNAVKSILHVRNLALALRKSSSVADLSRTKLLGEMDAEGSFSRFVYADFDTSIFAKGSADYNELLDYQNAIIKHATLIHSRIDPFATWTRRLGKPLFWYSGVDAPLIFERDRRDDGRELSLLLTVATYQRDYTGLVTKMYRSLSDYYVQLTIPIRDRKGRPLGMISADGINAHLPEIELSPRSLDLLESFTEVRREEGVAIYENAPGKLTEEQRNLILRAYSTIEADPEDLIKKHGFFILSRTQWNQILESGGPIRQIRTERFATPDGHIGYEIATREGELYREFFNMPVRPVRGYQLRIAQEFADMLAPLLMNITAYYQHGVEVAGRVMKRIDEKRKTYLDVVAHRMKNSLGPLAMSVIRLNKQVDRLHERVEEGSKAEVDSVRKRMEIVRGSIDNLQNALKLLDTSTKAVTTRNLYEFVTGVLNQDHYLQAVGVAYQGEPAEHEVATNFSVFEEVMRIVVENAREAILAQRQRTPEFTGAIEYTVTKQGEDVVLALTNFGPPLPQGVDPFSESFTTSKSGKGLGLARYLVGELNGRIDIANKLSGEEYVGVEVRILLPSKTRLDVFDVGTIYG